MTVGSAGRRNGSDITNLRAVLAARCRAAEAEILRLELVVVETKAFIKKQRTELEWARRQAEHAGIDL